MTKYAVSHAKQSQSQKQTITKRRKITLLPFCFIGLVLVLLSGVYYLGLLNEKATYGYKVSALENKLEELKGVNQKLELTKIELQQINRLEELALNLEMVKSDRVDYLSITDETVAVR